MSAVARVLPRGHLRQLRLIISPSTLRRWHTILVRRHRAYLRRAPGWPRTAQAIRALALEVARDNPGWGYRRIQGELTGLGYKIAPSAARRLPGRAFRLAWMTPVAVGDVAAVWFAVALAHLGRCLLVVAVDETSYLARQR